MKKINCHQDFTRKYLYNKSDFPKARILSEPKCQGELKSWYLVYRCFLLLFWSSIVLVSIFEIGSQRPKYYKEKWLIYITHWQVALGFIQSLLGTIVATKRWMLQKDPKFEADLMNFGKLEKGYSFFYVVTSVMSVGVTLIYWTASHDPEVYDIDPQNVMTHICNSILMLADNLVSKTAFRLWNFWWSSIVVTIYLTFTVLYYLADGRDVVFNEPFVYKILDWRKPKLTSLIGIGAIVLSVLLHFFFYWLSLFGSFLNKKLCKTNDIEIV